MTRTEILIFEKKKSKNETHHTYIPDSGNERVVDEGQPAQEAFLQVFQGQDLREVDEILRVDFCPVREQHGHPRQKPSRIFGATGGKANGARLARLGKIIKRRVQVRCWFAVVTLSSIPPSYTPSSPLTPTAPRFWYHLLSFCLG